MPEVIRPSASVWVRDPLTAELSGVSAAIGRGIGVSVVVIRIALLVSGSLLLATIPTTLLLNLHPLASLALAGLGASGLVAYVISWWALPVDAQAHRSLLEPLVSARVRGKPALVEGAGARAVLASPAALALRWLALAGIVSLSGFVIVTTLASILAPDLSSPQVLGGGIGMIAGGTTLSLLPLSLVDIARFSGTITHLPHSVTVCTVVGAVSILIGASVAVYAVLGSEAMAASLLASVFALGLLSMVVIPWARALWRGMREESNTRALARHQAEVASHLHDSVLQTLSLIQRESTSPATMKRLARDQEVELRRWLYGSVSRPASLAAYPAAVAAPALSPEPRSFRESVEDVIQEVERAQGVEISVVCVGDTTLTEHLVPLLNALREAATNAAQHAGDGIQVFADASGDILEVFVRDRGPGFDLDAIPEGRMGVRHSIVGRMSRAGGSATIQPALGGGTEVTLTLQTKDNS